MLKTRQKAVMKAILRQDVGWFDVSKPEELASKVSAGIALVHKGLEGSNYLIFLAIGSVVTGIAGGFAENWAISLVVESGSAPRNLEAPGMSSRGTPCSGR